MINSKQGKTLEPKQAETKPTHKTEPKRDEPKHDKSNEPKQADTNEQRENEAVVQKQKEAVKPKQVETQGQKRDETVKKEQNETFGHKQTDKKELTQNEMGEQKKAQPKHLEAKEPASDETANQKQVKTQVIKQHGDKRTKLDETQAKGQNPKRDETRNTHGQQKKSGNQGKVSGRDSFVDSIDSELKKHEEKKVKKIFHDLLSQEVASDEKTLAEFVTDKLKTSFGGHWSYILHVGKFTGRLRHKKPWLIRVMHSETCFILFKVL